MAEQFDRNNLVRLDDGSLVERDVLHIAERISEYDPNLKLQYLESAARIGDAPYRVVELCKDGQWRPLFSVWELDQRVLDRIHLGDMLRNPVGTNMEVHNAAIRAELKRKEREELGAAQDITEHMLKSPKGRWSFTDGDKKVTVDDAPNRPAKVEYREP